MSGTRDVSRRLQLPKQHRRDTNCPRCNLLLEPVEVPLLRRGELNSRRRWWGKVFSADSWTTRRKCRAPGRPDVFYVAYMVTRQSQVCADDRLCVQAQAGSRCMGGSAIVQRRRGVAGAFSIAPLNDHGVPQRGSVTRYALIRTANLSVTSVGLYLSSRAAMPACARTYS